jgi:hypothetical protein
MPVFVEVIGEVHGENPSVGLGSPVAEPADEVGPASRLFER